MTANLIDHKVIAELARKASNVDKPGGDKRLKVVVNRLLRDLMVAIDELDITMDEFWAGVAYLARSGQNNELGLFVPGVALEHFLDLRMDEAERRAGIEGGTPRAIEGPLYVAGAPMAHGEARLDDGTDKGEWLYVEGQVRDTKGKPIKGAKVEVWHADTRGFYSFFGPPQSPFNLRRTIIADAEGRYRFRSIMPSGYGCPPDSSILKLLGDMGRHGMRPAHVHFFLSAPGFRHLTTQFNIDGDKYLHDDFAFGTRHKELIAPVARVSDAAEMKKHGFDKPFAKIHFDFVLAPEKADAPKTEVVRDHAPAPAAH
jgi:catechol 1,2-dioxygenase